MLYAFRYLCASGDLAATNTPARPPLEQIRSPARDLLRDHLRTRDPQLPSTKFSDHLLRPRLVSGGKRPEVVANHPLTCRCSNVLSVPSQTPRPIRQSNSGALGNVVTKQLDLAPTHLFASHPLTKAGHMRSAGRLGLRVSREAENTVLAMCWALQNDKQIST